MAEFSMTIDGGAVPTTDTFAVVNPATAEVFAQAPDCTRAQLDAAMESAQKAYRDWRSDEGARREALHRAADALFGAADAIGPVLTAEQGKPLTDAGGVGQAHDQSVEGGGLRVRGSSGWGELC